MNKISDILFSLRKPKVVIVSGSNSQMVKENIQQVLKPYFTTIKEALVIENNLENIKEIKFLMNNSPLPVLALSDVPFEKIKAVINEMPKQGFLILKFDEEIVKRLKEETSVSFLSFGFDKRADFSASDININGGVNFKINHKGNIIPVWLEKSKGEEQIPFVLEAAAVGTVLGLNLIEVSQAFKTPDKK